MVVTSFEEATTPNLGLEPAGVGNELLTHEAGIVTLGTRQIYTTVTDRRYVPGS